MVKWLMGGAEMVGGKGAVAILILRLVAGLAQGPEERRREEDLAEPVGQYDEDPLARSHFINPLTPQMSQKFHRSTEGGSTSRLGVSVAIRCPLWCSGH